jgi:dihydrofolate reductase
MGKIRSNFFISLDGVVESPDQWHFGYFNDEMGEAISAGAATTDAFLMGRVLYSEWSEYWPQQSDDDFAKFLNNVPKYVLSSTLTEAAWNNTTIVSGDVAAQVRQIKANTERDITMSGSATTVRWLLAEGLLDELNLLVHPVAVGHGQRLFAEGASHSLKLLRSTTFSTGVVYLTYAPA